MILDYHREYQVHIKSLLASLEEQARALQVARHRLTGPDAFSDYVNDFCARMNVHISPGHHILVLDEDGRILASSQFHSGPEVTRTLIAANPNQNILAMKNHGLAQVRLTDKDGSIIIVAQYLDHIQGMLRRQFIVRFVITAITATVLIFVIILAVQFWGIHPLQHLTEAARAWSQRKFDIQADPSGPEEFRFLSREFNSMAKQLEKHEQERLSEMEGARHIQANLLPRSVPQIMELDIEVQYHPAGHVAGDLYDIFCLPEGQVVIALWDVSGHGIGAALLTGVVKMSLRYHLLSTGNLAQAMKVVNEDLRSCTPAGSFVTACVGLWNSHDRTWQYCAAGHPGGFRLAQGEIETLPGTAPLLGVMAPNQWSINTIRLSVGDKIFLYTDGVADIGRTNDHNETQYLAQLILKTNHFSFTEQVEHVLKDAEHKSEKNAVDDATIVAFEVKPCMDTSVEYTI